MLLRTAVALAGVLALVSCGSQAPRPLPSTAAADSTQTRIRLKNGRVLVFANDFTEGDRYVRHTDEGILPGLGYPVVHRTYYEGDEYLLIHPRTGHPTVVPARPVVSPAGERIAVASMDFEAGYAPNLLQVWRTTPDSLALEWELETGTYAPATGWGASDPRWIDEHTIEFTKHEPEDGLANPMRTSRARLVRQPNQGWRIQSAP